MEEMSEGERRVATTRWPAARAALVIARPKPEEEPVTKSSFQIAVWGGGRVGGLLNQTWALEKSDIWNEEEKEKKMKDLRDGGCYIICG